MKVEKIRFERVGDDSFYIMRQIEVIKCIDEKQE